MLIPFSCNRQSWSWCWLPVICKVGYFLQWKLCWRPAWRRCLKSSTFQYNYHPQSCSPIVYKVINKSHWKKKARSIQCLLQQHEKRHLHGIGSVSEIAIAAKEKRINVKVKWGFMVCFVSYCSAQSNLLVLPLFWSPRDAKHHRGNADSFSWFWCSTSQSPNLWLEPLHHP